MIQRRRRDAVVLRILLDAITRRFEELGEALNHKPHFDLSEPYDYQQPTPEPPPKGVVPRPGSSPLKEESCGTFRIKTSVTRRRLSGMVGQWRDLYNRCQGSLERGDIDELSGFQVPANPQMDPLRKAHLRQHRTLRSSIFLRMKNMIKFKITLK